MSTQLPPLWQPLSSDTSTRLLTLHPATESDATIRTTLEEVNLKDKPSFEAISYTWGKNDTQHSITVNGFTVILRQNLFQALTRFRGDSLRVLWVDALCISQTDVKEKGQQVQQMGNIFRSADKVLVWLGEHADESEALFEPWPWTASRVFRRLKPIVLDPQDSARIKLPAELERRQRIWSNFMSRPYFTRTWVIQELVLARSLLIHCGDSVTSWDKLIRFDLSGKSHPKFDGIPIRVTGESMTSTSTPGNDDFSSLIGRLGLVERFKKAHAHYERQGFRLPGSPRSKALEEDGYSSSWISVESSMTIADLAYTFRKTQCSDVRDKIYALISLDYEKSNPIIPDYGLTAYQTLLSVVRQRAAGDWQLTQVRKQSFYSSSRMRQQECREAVQVMAADIGNTLGLAADTTRFTAGGNLIYLRGLETLEDIHQVLEILIEDERKLTCAQRCIELSRIDDAIALYHPDQDDAEDLYPARGDDLDVYDVFLAITRRRIERVAPGKVMDISGTTSLNHTIQVARALGIPDEHVNEHGRWCLPQRDRFCWEKHGSRYFDYDFKQLKTLETTMCALKDFISRKRAGVATAEWTPTPEAMKMREELGLAGDGMPI